MQTFFQQNTLLTENTNQTANSSPLPVLFIRGEPFYQHSLAKIRARISNWIHSLLWGMIICILTLTTLAVWISEYGCVIISHSCIGMQFLIHGLNYIFAQLISVSKRSPVSACWLSHKYFHKSEHLWTENSIIAILIRFWIVQNSYEHVLSNMIPWR